MSLLGIHLHGGVPAGWHDRIAAARPAWVKCIQRPDAALWAQSIGARVLMRTMLPADDWGRLPRDPALAAMAVLDANRELLELAARHNWWVELPPNEPHLDAEGWRRLNDYLTVVQHWISEDYGVRTAIVSAATGTLEAGQWRLLAGALQAAVELGNALAVHEYAVRIPVWFGETNEQAAIQQRRSLDEHPDPHDHGWLVGRWRRMKRAGVIPLTLPVLVTETGWDKAGEAALVALGIYEPVFALNQYSDDHARRMGFENVVAMLRHDLELLENIYRAEGDVLAAFPFTFGTMDPSWAGYDYTVRYGDVLLEHIKAFAGGGNADSDDGGETGMTDINLIVERLNSVERRLSRIEALMLPPEPVYITPTARLNLRAGPGTTYAIRRVLEPGEQLEQLGAQDEWLNVKAARDGLTGWVHRSYTRPFELTRAPAPDRVEAVRPVAQPYLGLHGPADPGMWAWEIVEGGYSVVKAARPEAVKIVAGGDVRGYLVARLREYGVRFVVARLYASVGASTTPAEFLRAVERPMLELHNGGVGWFEIHNEPNLAAEGLSSAWQNAVEFERWYLETLGLLRARLPGVKFGLPGMSPNGPDFVTACPEAVRRSDWLGYHVYWGADGTTWQQAVERVNAFALAHPDKPVLVTEFSNPAVNVDKAEKAWQYLLFYRASFAPNVHALFAFVSNASHGFEHETWAGSQIPAIIGAR